jgi:dTDP-4-dehydrorhamnose reductase
MASLASLLRGATHVVNAAGTVKPRINEKDEQSIADALFVNGIFPHRLAALAEEMDFRLIHLTTDCVYSGDIRKAPYVENLPPDATDVYGMSKFMGEMNSPNSLLLRCSIIGPELRGHYSLLSWALSQEAGSTVRGFTDQYWNGVTTLQYAAIILGALTSPVWLPDDQSLHHIVPRNWVTKAQLLRAIYSAYHRDVAVKDFQSGQEKDMRLGTKFQGTNLGFWQLAGLNRPMVIEEMINELAAYKYPWD